MMWSLMVRLVGWNRENEKWGFSIIWFGRNEEDRNAVGWVSAPTKLILIPKLGGKIEKKMLTIEKF